jgi:hypothetical protein
MSTLDDVVEIKTKACASPYVRREAETFMALRLEIPNLAGISDKVHLHILRLDRFEREILPLNRIDTINGKPVEKPQTEWSVKGSKGKEYTVRLTGSGYKCNCMGFKFKKHCSHIDGIKG